MYELEKELEDARQDLALRPDFVVTQLFAFFDVTAKQRISLFEIFNGLYELGITPNKEDLAITIKEFDHKSQGTLDFEDFFKMICPQAKQYRDMLRDR
jgi:Ca2+-binding EF-hand superfamily protein